MIKTFAQACKKLKLDPVKSLPKVGHMPKTEQVPIIALTKLQIIVRALNDGWTPDWNNGLWDKWIPWFWMNNPGFRFCDSNFSRAVAYSGAGSRLCLKSKELADYAGKEFLPLWKDLMDIPAAKPAKKPVKKAVKKK